MKCTNCEEWETIDTTFNVIEAIISRRVANVSDILIAITFQHEI